MTKRYPAQYRCEHCGAVGFTKKDGRICPSCRFGILVKMHWNGFGWC